MNTDEYQEINIDGTQDEVYNKKKKNNGGFGKGVVVGILLTAVSMFLFIKCDFVAFFVIGIVCGVVVTVVFAC